ncbi:MAG: hypothetical protein KME52_09330 [Desmonostoc geniculatum HA4340-LM1]|jgi:hypothetical protein|nr:hypothetical protein [Desmonostoc geniculatum HA4340-LM1]
MTTLLKLRKGFSYDEAILLTQLCKYAYDVFQYDDGSVHDIELKTVYKALYRNQGWQLVHTIRNDDTNIRAIVLKNTQLPGSHQYVIAFRGSIVSDRGAVELTDFASDFDWELIRYEYLSIQRAKVVRGFHLAFNSVADQIQFFFKTLRGELKPSDFRRLEQLSPLRKFACINALADAGAIRLGSEFEQQAEELVEKVVADGEIDDDEELEKILQFLEEELLPKLSPLNEPIEVWVTGHSLGASLSQFAGLSLRRWFGPASDGGLLIKVYAIAAPKIGNPTFIKYYNEQIGEELSYRVENVFDYMAPTFPYNPPFPFSAIARDGVRIGNIYIGNYANGGEAITVMGFGGQSASVSFGGIVEIPFSVPFPHSVETYLQLLQEQKQFWSGLIRPVKDILRPFLIELIRDEQKKGINLDRDSNDLNGNENSSIVRSDEDITIIK